MIKEDIKPGYAPSEISFGGYTTKNLHHSADAARSFQDTIERAGEQHPAEVLAALKATDTYMKLNDMHLEQGIPPDAKEVNKWKAAHQIARDSLHRIGEFMHHMDYWHMHEHELQDELTGYNPETAGAEMADSYEPQGDLVEALTDKTIKSGDKIKVARVIADMLGVEKAESMSPEVAINTGLRSIKNKRMTPELIGVVKKMLNLAQEVGIKYDASLAPKATMAEEPEVNTNSKRNIAGDILRYKDYQKLVKMSDPSLANTQMTGEDPTEVGNTLDQGDQDHVRRMKAKYKTEEVSFELDEAADMNALRKQLDKHTNLAVQANRAGDDEMTKKHQEHMNKIKDKMEKLVRSEEVELEEAIKIGSKVTVHAPGKSYHGTTGTVGEIRNGAYKGAPKTYTVHHGEKDAIQLDKKNIKLNKEEVELEEATVDVADIKKKEMISQKDKETLGKLATLMSKEKAKKVQEAKATPCGRCGTTHVPPSEGGTCPALKEDEELDEDMASADYKINPQTGRKYRAHKINFKNSTTGGKPVEGEAADDRRDMKEEAEKEMDLSDDELDKMADTIDHEDDIMDLYDDGELKIVDQDTGEEVEDKEEVNEEQLNEVLSRSERMRARIRFLRTASKRARRLKIVLSHRSDSKTITKRARRLAINLIKQRIARKPVSQMNIGEKERIEKMLQSRKGLIDRLAMKLVPRIRRVEADRLSHGKSTGSTPTPAF